MSTPVKRTQWDEDLSQFHKDHGLSKKVLLNCCLFRRIISWASPNKKVSVQCEMMKLLPNVAPNCQAEMTFSIKGDVVVTCACHNLQLLAQHQCHANTAQAETRC
ncbi:unnamed protein product [Leuciscus chuanchicus]